MAKKIVNTRTPDENISADFGQLLDRVFGTVNKPKSFAEILEETEKLSTLELVALRGILGDRENMFRQINAKIDANLSEKAITDFKSEDTLISVVDQASGTCVGEVGVKTVTTVSRSTKNAKTATKIKELLENNNLTGTYTKTSVELKNDVLYEAKKNNALPAEISALLTEETTSSRCVTYSPARKQEEK